MGTTAKWLVAALLVGCLLAGNAGATNGVVGPSNCDETGFNTVLSAVDGSGGGTITFNCGTATITFTNYKQIANAVTIDGGGTITLDGNNSSALFQFYASSQVVLKNLTLTRGGTGGAGQALENFGALTLDHVKVLNNVSSGIAVFYNSGTLRVIASTFSGNQSSGSSVDGGAIDHESGYLHVSGSTFNNNSAGRNGGAIYAVAPMSVMNSTFSANTAASGGGAIYDASGSASTILYATIVGNSATFGAGLYSAGDGGGNATLSIGKSIISANTTGNCDGLGSSSGYNLSNDTGCGGYFNGAGDLQSQTLNMGALGNNGGPTQTMLPAAGNPAINHVPVANCAPNVDQRGGGRPAGGGCDSGAVEVSAVLDVIFYDGFD